MKLEKLRTIRIIVSTIFFLATSFLFLELSGVFTQIGSDSILFLQFTPSLLSFLTAASFASIGFILVIVITAVFGRVYCSSVCPLGYFIDVLNYLKNFGHKRRTGKVRRYKFSAPFEIIRHLIFSLTVLTLLIGTGAGLVLLDPYSTFGRFVSTFVRPLLVGLNNGVVFLLEQFENFALVPYHFIIPRWEVLLFTTGMLALVLFLSLRRGRFYCNTVCPVGAFLGLISRFAVFKIKVDNITCIECGICETACKAECIDSGNKFIDYSRCVGCFDCFRACPTEAIIFQTPEKRELEIPRTKLHSGRRNFLISIGLMGISAAKSIAAQTEKKINVYTKNTNPEVRESAVSPPGSKSINHFTANCTACTLCVSACPTNVLQPSFLEYGIGGFLMPHMQNLAGYCNYECKICGDVCPTDAILPLSIEEKKLVQIGKAFFEKDNCVVLTQKTECGACAEHCPTKAVKMKLDPELNLRVPEVTDKICVGCGACEHACPTIPFKAIYVKGNPLHQIAEKPQEEELNQEVDMEADFPF